MAHTHHIKLQKDILHNHIQQIINTTPLHTNLAQNQHTEIPITIKNLIIDIHTLRNHITLKNIPHHIKLIRNLPQNHIPINPIPDLPQNHILIDPIPDLPVLIQKAHIEALQHILVHPQNLTEKNNKLRFMNNR